MERFEILKTKSDLQIRQLLFLPLPLFPGEKKNQFVSGSSETILLKPWSEL